MSATLLPLFAQAQTTSIRWSQRLHRSTAKNVYCTPGGRVISSSGWVSAPVGTFGGNDCRITISKVAAYAQDTSFCGEGGGVYSDQFETDYAFPELSEMTLSAQGGMLAAVYNEFFEQVVDHRRWSSSGGGNIILWDRRGMRLPGTIRSSEEEQTAVDISETAHLVAFTENFVILYDYVKQVRFDTIHHLARQVRFSPDGAMLAFLGANGSVLLWDRMSRNSMFDLPANATSVRFSADGNTIVTAGSDSMVRTWDVRTGALLKTFVGHSAPCSCAVMTADGRFIVSGGRDSTVRVWDNASGMLLRTLVDSVSVASVDVSSDGLSIVGGDERGGVTVWDGTGVTTYVDSRDRNIFPTVSSLVVSPNPCTTGAQITYELPVYVVITILLYNELGQKVEVILDDLQEAGPHQLLWTPKTALPSGAYRLELIAGKTHHSQSMIVAR